MGTPCLFPSDDDDVDLGPNGYYDEVSHDGDHDFSHFALEEHDGGGRRLQQQEQEQVRKENRGGAIPNTEESQFPLLCILLHFAAAAFRLRPEAEAVLQRRHLGRPPAPAGFPGELNY